MFVFDIWSENCLCKLPLNAFRRDCNINALHEASVKSYKVVVGFFLYIGYSR